MPFKIVQIIEAGNIVLTAVPSMWEENNNLFWPNNRSRIRTLLQEEYSMPQKEKWEKIPCILKRKNITNIELAEKEIDSMTLISDTDGDTVDISGIVGSNSRKRKIFEVSKKPDFNDQIPFEMRRDYNSTRSSEDFPEGLADEPASHQNEIPILASPIDNKIAVLLQDNFNDRISWDGSETTNMLKAVLENQGEIIAQQAKFQTSLDTLAGMMADGHHIKTTSDEKKDGMVFNPIGSVDDLKTLEESLGNISFFTKVVESLSIICGKSGKTHGLDSCYKLVDHFFCRDFLAKCSWTGNTKIPDKTKIPLKFYKNVRKCFLSTVLLADKDFDEGKCEVFFKRILKNSLARKAQHTYISKHKIRPNNLRYKKKFEDGSDTSNEKNNKDAEALK